MAIDSTIPRSRRALLGAGLGAVAASVASAALRPLPVAAAGDDGAIIHVGDTFANAETQTTLANQANDNIVLYVASNSDSGHGSGTAVDGHSDHGKGVVGDSAHGIGVFGQCGSNVGVWGQSDSSYGVLGSSTSESSVYGTATRRTNPRSSASPGQQHRRSGLQRLQ